MDFLERLDFLRDPPSPNTPLILPTIPLDSPGGVSLVAPLGCPFEFVKPLNIPDSPLGATLGAPIAASSAPTLCSSAPTLCSSCSI